MPSTLANEVTTGAATAWPKLTGYEAEVVYKIYIDGVFVADHTNGYYTTEAFTPAIASLATFGSGTHAVQVRQSVGGAAYTVTGNGTLLIAAISNNLTCG